MQWHAQWRPASIAPFLPTCWALRVQGPVTPYPSHTSTVLRFGTHRHPVHLVASEELRLIRSPSQQQRPQRVSCAARRDGGRSVPCHRRLLERGARTEPSAGPHRASSPPPRLSARQGGRTGGARRLGRPPAAAEPAVRPPHPPPRSRPTGRVCGPSPASLRRGRCRPQAHPIGERARQSGGPARSRRRRRGLRRDQHACRDATLPTTPELEPGPPCSLFDAAGGGRHACPPSCPKPQQASSRTQPRNSRPRRAALSTRARRVVPHRTGPGACPACHRARPQCDDAGRVVRIRTASHHRSSARSLASPLG
eukprot:scaffold18704_cov108-Isochrysis_galbana.AAC.1